jgi:hypothetical protein
VIYQQELERRGGDPDDPRNHVPVAFACHGNHHGRSRPFPLERLPDAVYEFAAELMGPAAFDYLRRRYSGEDARLDALLREEIAE